MTMDKATLIKNGDKIKVEYTGTFDDGTVFDSSTKHGQPLAFEVGSGQIIKGFEQAVLGMSTGEEKKVHLKPGEAYGDHNPDLLKNIPRERFPAEPKPGMTIGLQAPDGNQFPAQVVSVTDKEVTIDLNHPLAGKALNFLIKVVEIA